MMDSLKFAASGDVVNLVLASRAYPYERTDDHTTLQGRLVHLDEIGVCLASDGGVITPAFDKDRYYLPAPTTGDLFPWGAIKRMTFVWTAAEYEARWREHEAQTDVFAAHNDRAPASLREYRDWASTQDRTQLEAMLAEAAERVIL